jgi:hypothetical protein
LFIEGVLQPVWHEQPVSFRPPAWDARDRPGSIEVPAGISTLIVEGVGAARRELADVIDASVWVQSDLAVTNERNLTRVGAGELPLPVHEQWMAEEIPFLAAQRPWERVDLIVAGTPALSHDPATELVVVAAARGPVLHMVTRRCRATRIGQGRPLASRLVQRPGTDEELATRQAGLQAEAAELLDELDRSGAFADLGPLAVTGSYISGLMCWRDLDVGLLVGADYSPTDVMQLVSRVLELPGVIGFDYRDERGDRSPTGQVKEERYHLPFLFERGDSIWRVDLTLWLHDPHENVTAWHRSLRESITPDQRAAALRIKDVWYRQPSYPEHVGGFEIYTAVIEDGIRTPEQFRRWLAARGFPEA